jgi:alpha-tubulin suppressor-like RCC1 family protein
MKNRKTKASGLTGMAVRQAAGLRLLVAVAVPAAELITLPRPEIDYRPAPAGAWPPLMQVSVAVGAAHSAVVTLKGQVFVQGLNNYGQLGVGSRRNEFRPLRVTAVRRTAALMMRRARH